MNQFEYKKRYDPDLGMYVKKHVHTGEIHGGGAFTVILKSVFKTAGKKAAETAATKTGEHVGKKAGDKIIQLLSKKNKATPEAQMIMQQIPQMTQTIPLTQNEINERVNRIISGGKLRNYVI